MDEVHAVAGTNRGASGAELERLDDLLERPAQRIGLSATVNPPERAAKFLAGALPVTVIATGGKPALDITVVEPAKTLGDGPVANGRRKGGCWGGRQHFCANDRRDARDATLGGAQGEGTGMAKAIRNLQPPARQPSDGGIRCRRVRR